MGGIAGAADRVESEHVCAAQLGRERRARRQDDAGQARTEAENLVF